LERFNGKYAQPEKAQSDANQNQHNWRRFTHAIRFLYGLAFLAFGPWESFQFSGLGPVLMCSSHSQHSPAEPTNARRQSQPAVPGGCNEVKVDKPPTTQSGQHQRYNQIDRATDRSHDAMSERIAS